MAVSPTSPNMAFTPWGRLDSLQDVGDASNYQTGIITHHWQPTTLRKHCVTRECKKEFGFFDRPHHCRRCGEVFCTVCSTYKRRLNLLALPDPNGKLYRVCKSCFEKGPQQIGQTRSWVALYKALRGQGHISSDTKAVPNGINISNFRKKVVLADECARLQRGFEESVTSSGLKRALLVFKDVVSTPQWQKSPFHVYGKMSKVCGQCRKPFSLIVTKKICVICGTAVCGGGENNCGKSDLLVYIPDGYDNSLPLQSSLAITGIVGCPPSEPQLCQYLVTCRMCHADIEEHQVQQFYSKTADLEASIREDDFWTRLNTINTKLQEMQLKVDHQMPKYQDLIEALEVAPSSRGTSTPSPDNKSNMQVLAKAQGDIGDLLTTVSMTIRTLSSIKPQTPPQATVMKNFIKRWCDYYQENMFLYRGLKRQLEEVTPIQMLTFIQDIVNKNAINCSYLTVHQMALEVLHLVTKHNLDDDIISHVLAVEEIVEADLQRALLAAGESWEEHKLCADQLTQQHIKEHRLIRPSRRLTKQLGDAHIHNIMFERCDYILSQVYQQLDAKCLHQSFRQTKEKVKVIREKVMVIKNGHGNK